MAEEKKREVAIVHYNTPELTEATILSLRKHGGQDYHVTVFDNSDKRPFKAQMKGVDVIDNTKGQIINFEVELARFPNKCESTQNGWGSDMHMMSVQKLWDLLPDGFLLLDSDVLIKKSVDHMWMKDQVAVGHVQEPQPGNRFHLARLVPMVLYINVPLCKKFGLKFFDPERSWMLNSPHLNDRRNWYDTGAAFYEDIHRKKNGCRGRRIDIRPLMEHFQKGSWLRSDIKEQAKWLNTHKLLWEPTPQMRGIKKIAICAIARNENRYAREWVEHYKKIGASKLFIYDNYFGNEEPIAEVLKDYVKSGLVEITDCHDRKNWQLPAYMDCYAKHGNDFAWIGFLDMDEYLRWEGRKKIESMFAPYQTGDALLINWRLFTDNGLVHYDDRPLSVRFTEVMPVDRHVKYKRPENDHVKCFVRGGLGTVRFGSPHHPEQALKCINTRGEEVPSSAFCAPFDHSVMRLDHYWTKTAEEWIGTKLVRGFASGHTYIENFMRVQADYFFRVNERTTEKEAIIYGKPETTK